MKRTSILATEREFNWEAVSKPYGEAIVRLVNAHPESAERA
jgi:hypothetical protein